MIGLPTLTKGRPSESCMLSDDKLIILIDYPGINSDTGNSYALCEWNLRDYSTINIHLNDSNTY